MRTHAVIVSIVALLVGCSVAPIEGENATGAKKGTTTPSSATTCTAPSPIGDRDPGTFPKCACAAGGAARCIPKEGIGALASHLEKCDGEKGACVPDTLLAKGGTAPIKCESIAGEGRCVSLCIPEVAKQEKLLDRGKGNVCAPDERCAPCLNPLENNAPTGLCEIGGEACASPDGGTSPAPSGSAVTCPYAGTPLKVDHLEACADGLRCVASDKIPAAAASMLAKCKNPNEVCAPEKSIAALGQYRPVACASVGGGEGRCMNANLPPVAAQKDLLPGAGCDGNERCVPCFDPMSGKPTGVCSTVSCDKPQKPAFTFKACCSSKGKCVPESIVPAGARESLGRDEGTCAKGDLCVPGEMLDQATKPAPCSASIPFVGSYTGVCVSDCLETLVPSGNCSGGRVCLPCNDPFDGTPTGAPGCPK